jgi:c-di-GMP phosphodiesterase
LELLNYTFDSSANLKQFIDNNLPKDANVLVQLFTGVLDVDAVQDILDILVSERPDISIIGASTAGEIADGVICTQTIQLSFSIFKHSTLKTRYYQHGDFQAGAKAAHELLGTTSKVVIAFSEALKGDPEAFLTGFSSMKDDIVIAGGNAGDNLAFNRTFVICANQIYFEGIVLCSIDSDVLQATTSYFLEWNPTHSHHIAHVEGYYIYASSTRRTLLQDQLDCQVVKGESAVASSGFFGYGEFYCAHAEARILNLSTTLLSLSESKSLHTDKDIRPSINNRVMFRSLTNFLTLQDRSFKNHILQLEQYKKVLDSNSIVSKTDINGVITYVNDEFCRVSGYTKEELLGQNHNIIRHPHTNDSVFVNMWETITKKNIWKSTIKNRTKDGNAYYVKSVIIPLVDENEQLLEYIAARTDVTELIQKDELIKQQFRDSLTALQNRASLLHRLDSKPDDYASLILINLDRFSDINDYFGYEAGDKILKEFAMKLQARHPNSYRISGDEFAVLCEHNLDKVHRAYIIKMITELENAQYLFHEDAISVFLSCGVAYGKKSEIYKLSHMALKENKRSNQQVYFYNDHTHLDQQVQDNIKIISMIQEGLKDDRFILFFQGIVDNETQKIVKYESLIRLKDTNGAIMSPFFFLEHAKKAKLYTRLTEVVIKKAFKKFADLDCEFSINLSLEDIESIKIVDLLINNLEKFKCGQRVVLEIVESEGISNFEEVSQFISKMKSYGCKIAIDDFGTGYSNFSYLSKFQIDYVKLDGSLIKDIYQNPSCIATVESIVHFAKKMGIKTIAEFVEDEKTYKFLKGLGIDFSQGYYFSKPNEELAY